MRACGSHYQYSYCSTHSLLLGHNTIINYTELYIIISIIDLINSTRDQVTVEWYHGVFK